MGDRGRRTVALVVVLGLAPGRAARASGDAVAALSGALLGDPSYRVKVQAALTLGRLKKRDARAVQALIEALRDDNEAVRAVAASSLGKIGEPSAIDALRTAAAQDASPAVRASAARSLALLQRNNSTAVASGSGPARFYIDVSAINPGKADAASAARVHDRLVAALGRLPNVTLDGAGPARARFYLDGSITNLAATAADGAGKVRTDCDARLIVATLPDKSIKTMITVGGSIDGTSDPSDIAASKSACLGDVAQQIAEKVQTFLETQR